MAGIVIVTVPVGVKAFPAGTATAGAFSPELLAVTMLDENDAFHDPATETVYGAGVLVLAAMTVGPPTNAMAITATLV